MISQDTKRSHTLQFSNYAFENLPNWSENLWLNETLNMNIYSSLMHNCQELEAVKMSFKKVNGEKNHGDLDTRMLFRD